LRKQAEWKRVLSLFIRYEIHANGERRRLSTENLFHKKNDEYATPNWIREGLFENWYDPCPLTEGLVDRDGLNSDWIGNRIFINPPYSRPLPWVEKAIIEAQKGKTVALLLKHDSSTQWWAKLHEAGAYFLPIMERLQFVTQKGRRKNRKAAAPFPSVLVILFSEGFSAEKSSGEREED
jgi:hypothetical protein